MEDWHKPLTRTIAIANVVDKQDEIFTEKALESQIGKEGLVGRDFDPIKAPIGTYKVVHLDGDELKAEIDITDPTFVAANLDDYIFRVAGTCHKHEYEEIDGHRVQVIKDFEIIGISMMHKDKDVYEGK